jgi:small subunit ribosomal protein S6
MAKYELMLIFKGTLEDKVVHEETKNIVAKINQPETTKVIDHGNQKLAYEINKNDKGHYIQINFDSEEGPEIIELSRQLRLQSNVIRFLLINLEKEYGYRAISNEKKVKKAELKKVRKEEYDNRKKAENPSAGKINPKFERKGREKTIYKNFSKSQEIN